MTKFKTLYIILALVVAALVLTFTLLVNISSQQKAPLAVQDSTDDTVINFSQNPSFEWVESYDLPLGTHRPEMIYQDGKLYVGVVYPDPDNDIQHRILVFDASDPSTIDFADTSNQFGISEEGSDHRIDMLGDSILSVFQVLELDPDATLNGPIEGPSEPFAQSQTLEMALFSLDGEEIARHELLYTEDMNVDDFPDMCILPWTHDSFLINNGGNALKIREISSDGEILNTYEYNEDPSRYGAIGNSLIKGKDGQLMLFSSTMGPNDSRDLTITLINSDFSLGETVVLEQPETEDVFPTSVIYENGYYLIGYKARDIGGDIALEKNPTYPYLMIVDEDFKIVDNFKVSDEGIGGVHSFITRIDDRLFYAHGSSTVLQDDPSGMAKPFVMIEEFIVSFE